MPISYKNKIYTTLGTPTTISEDHMYATNNSGFPTKNYSVNGKTVVWNQMLKFFNFRNEFADSGIEFIRFRIRRQTEPYTVWFEQEISNPTVVNTIFTATYTGVGEMVHNGRTINIPFNEFNAIKDHKYYASINFLSTDTNSIGGIYYTNAQLFDLTQMFGARNEPNSVEEFKAIFPNEYYPYNSGELKSVFGYDEKSSMLKKGITFSPEAYAGTKAANGVTFTNNENGTITINGTATDQVDYLIYGSGSWSYMPMNAFANTKYLFFSHDTPENSRYKWIVGGTADTVFPYEDIQTQGKILSVSEDKIGTSWMVLRVEKDVTVENETITPQLFNLTKIFGPGNEPNTVEDFLKFFPTSEFDYSTGDYIGEKKLKVEASGIERFQLLDKSKYPATTTINGVTFTNNGDGTITANGTATDRATLALNDRNSPMVLGKGFIVGDPEVGSAFINYDIYDRNGNWLVDNASYGGKGKIFTMKEEAAYGIVYIVIEAGTSANNLIFKPQLFELTQMFGDGNEPATPEEFWQRVPKKIYGYNPSEYKSVNIPSSKYFPDGMRSAGSAYDEINFLSQKAIKRIGAVDMGTLDWLYNSVASHELFLAAVDGIKLVSPTSVKGNLVCSKYTTASADDVYIHAADKTVAVLNAGNQLWVYDTSYGADVAAFKAAMSGVMLYYELATPVETTITPSLQALSTYNGFTSFSAPNSLIQNGPLSVTYYAEGGENPESGWLTSYKRKLYMGRNIEWNQLFNKGQFPNEQTLRGVTFTPNSMDGTIAVNGTMSNADDVHFNFNTVTLVVGHKYLFGTGLVYTGVYKLQLADLNASVDYQAWSDTIFECAGGSSFVAYIDIYTKNNISNLIFKPQLFDLTQMFGAGNEPTTPEEFWSYFDHKLYPYNSGETQPLFKISRKSQWGS